MVSEDFRRLFSAFEALTDEIFVELVSLLLEEALQLLLGCTYNHSISVN